MHSNESEAPSEKFSREDWERMASEAGAHLKAEREFRAYRIALKAKQASPADPPPGDRTSRET